MDAILSHPTPKTRDELSCFGWFLGLADYYRCFCHNFSVVVAPLTYLCIPAGPFVATIDSQHAFDSAKSLFCNASASSPWLHQALQVRGGRQEMYCVSEWHQPLCLTSDISLSAISLTIPLFKRKPWPCNTLIFLNHMYNHNQRLILIRCVLP